MQYNINDLLKAYNIQIYYKDSQVIVIYISIYIYIYTYNNYIIVYRQTIEL